MLSKKLIKELNKQINEEMYSAYMYRAIAAYLLDKGYAGAGSWMKVQAQEEDFHADKFYNYIITRGEKVELHAIEKPPIEYGSYLECFEASLKHEQHITARINLLTKMAREENDYSTEEFLHWYVMEQREEEENVQGVIDQIKLFGNSEASLYQLDKDLGMRTFTPPVI